MHDLTKGSPLKVMLQFAIPILLGYLFNLAYNLADTRIIGDYLGNDALAAVGSVSTLNDLIVGFVVGMSNGFAVLTSRFFGMKNMEKVRRNFAQSLLWGLLITVLLVAGSMLGLEYILNWLNVAPEQRTQAVLFISVILYGLVFSCVYNVMASSLRAIGDAYTPLFFLIFSTVLNVGLDILCVGRLEMGVRGAAIATVISQLTSAVICFIYAMARYEIFRFHLSDLMPIGEDLRELLGGGFSMAFMNCLVAFGTLTLQTAINTFGTNTIVAHTAARKITSMYMLPSSVLGSTMATYAGQNFGAGEMGRIRKGLLCALGISYGWVVIVQIMTQTICPVFIKAVTATTNQEVIDTACLYLRVDTCFYILVPTITILRNSLQGMGDHVTPVISSSLELVGKVLIAMLLTPVIAYWGIIWAEPIVWAIMVIPLICSMWSRLRKIK